ncbi:MAG TPA: TlpA disulfide reductase family protein [Pyrinomonadaceae bacterium]|nr:TlpA disulfide reductase family protein [Pyrinomonadaceae bacterium]
MRVLSIVFLTIAFCLSAYAQQSLREGSAAPEFTAPAMNGQVFDLNQLKGKVVVVTFWSTRCAICHSEIPKLNKLADKYRDKGVVFLALTTDNESKVDSYLRSNPFNFDILPNSFGIVLQYADRDRQGNIDIGFPAHFLVNQNGQIEMKGSGWDKTPELESKIARLVSQGSSTAAAAQK